MSEPPRLLRGRRRLLLAALVANGLCQAALAGATALVVRGAFDHLVRRAPTASTQRILTVGILLAGIALGAAALRARERSDAERLGQRYVHALRMTLYGHMLEVSPRAMERRSQGAVFLRFVGDLTAVRQWVSNGIARLAVAATAGIGSLLALALVSPVLAGTAGVVLAAGVVAGLAIGPRLRSRAREARRRRSRLAADVGDRLGAMAVVQVFGQARRERRRLGRQSRALRNAMVERARVAGTVRAVAEGTAALASAATLVVGSLEVQAGRASAGTVVAAMMIVGLLLPRLRELGRVQEYRQNARVSMDRIRDFLGSPRLAGGDPDLTLDSGPGRLAFRDVGVDGALSGISAEAEPGSVVALVGANGAGKSTLLALAARLLDPDEGAVTIDGQDLAELHPSEIRRFVGMVAPDLPLLRGTVRRNLTYARPDASPEQIDEACRLCGLDELIERLPDGLETKLRDRGRGLSAGERQRIALARAVLAEPSLLLLDEAESNLDGRAARAAAEVIRRFRGRCTVLLATHSEELAGQADVVWELDDGELRRVRLRADEQEHSRWQSLGAAVA